MRLLPSGARRRIGWGNNHPPLWGWRREGPKRDLRFRLSCVALERVGYAVQRVLESVQFTLGRFIPLHELLRPAVDVFGYPAQCLLAVFRQDQVSQSTQA